MCGVGGYNSPRLSCYLRMMPLTNEDRPENQWTYRERYPCGPFAPRMLSCKQPTVAGPSGLADQCLARSMTRAVRGVAEDLGGVRTEGHMRSLIDVPLLPSVPVAYSRRQPHLHHHAVHRFLRYLSCLKPSRSLSQSINPLLHVETNDIESKSY